MTFGIWLTFLLAACLVSLSPGAGAINTMNSGMTHGVRATLPTILGLQLGYAIQILVVAVGLGALLASSTTAFLVIKWIGVAYLVWLGIQKWRTSGAVAIQGRAESAPHRQFWQAALVNLTNPKATVFLVALFPQFIAMGEPAASHVGQLLVMGVTLLGVDVLVMGGYAVLASQFKAFITSASRMRIVNRVFGSFFILAAGVLALYRRA
ncbi:homoserine/homoserine lactone efflux protein [Salinicola sp. JS01]|uniref:homoserine/homoserine lactone efflux protein n=1 Tax=Salinicola sp. JS01 TaxID=3050071 RepID=UPI00255B9E9E|nr:homoserine/homoserine lactone efflux protein [Salinicola sp. JS01]WIX32985.1 homoserine/homoserine lactone efflux protein [Salinicola sp. JS01]